MDIAARTAASNDIGTLVHLYPLLEAEQAALKPMWPLAVPLLKRVMG